VNLRAVALGVCGRTTAVALRRARALQQGGKHYIYTPTCVSISISILIIRQTDRYQRQTDRYQRCISVHINYYCIRSIAYLCSNVPRLIAVVTHFRPAARAACVSTLTCMYVRVSNAFYERAHGLSIWKTDKITPQPGSHPGIHPGSRSPGSLRSGNLSLWKLSR